MSARCGPTVSAQPSSATTTCSRTTTWSVRTRPSIVAGRVPIDVRTQFHEPFVLFGFLAGITSLHLVTGILILPQRQTVLVAQQAAELDLLSGGRLRVGVGVGWNPVEYDALGAAHHGFRARAFGRND